MQESLRLLPGQLLSLLMDPTSNLPAAFILYGIVVVVVLILLVVAIMGLMAKPDEEDGGAETIGREPGATRRPLERLPRVKRVRTPRSVILTLSVVAVVFCAAWILAGYTTSMTSVCAGCHVETPHAAAEKARDPHAATACIACHEPGGAYGRYVSGVPGRLLHFVNGLAGASTPDEYGRVTQAACLTCHRAAISAETLNKDRGLKMSHTEPLAASAACLDCHIPRGGVVSTYNAGMNPCLRCHDSRSASSECSTCHDKNAANAARVRASSFASEQIKDVKCGGCHDEKKECDSCHGTRMPHSKAFMASAHARAGAVDFWYNGGKACARCHTATRRPCARCHGSLLGQGHLTNYASIHQDASSAACDRCHQRWAPSKTRDFCRDVCHSPAAIAGSPR